MATIKINFTNYLLIKPFSTISGIAILAVPADVYYYGISYWMMCMGLVITPFITIWVYLPVFFKLQLTSSYEYLELRFDKRLRLLTSFLFLLSMILFLPIVIYIPALALEQGKYKYIFTVLAFIEFNSLRGKIPSLLKS